MSSFGDMIDDYDAVRKKLFTKHAQFSITFNPECK